MMNGKVESTLAKKEKMLLTEETQLKTRPLTKTENSVAAVIAKVSKSYDEMQHSSSAESKAVFSIWIDKDPIEAGIGELIASIDEEFEKPPAERNNIKAAEWILDKRDLKGPSLEDVEQVLNSEAEEVARDELNDTIASLDEQIKLEWAKNPDERNFHRLSELVLNLGLLLCRKMSRLCQASALQEVLTAQKALEELEKTYHSKKGMAISVIVGGISVVAGLVGMTGGFGGLIQTVGLGWKEISPGFQTMSSLSMAISTTGGGIQSITNASKDSLEGDKEVKRQKKTERDEAHRQSQQSSQQASSAMNQYLSNLKEAIQAEYQAKVRAVS